MNFNSIKNWFRRSETIVWARLQLLVGCVWTALSMTDMAPILDPKYLTYWLIFSGAVTEYLRRRGTETQSVLINPNAPAGEAPVIATYLTDARTDILIKDEIIK